MKSSRKNSLLLYTALCFFITFFTCAMPHLAQAEVDITKVSTFEQDLENNFGKDSKTVPDIIKAKDFYFKTFTEQDTLETRDAAFLAFYKYYMKIAEDSFNDEVFKGISELNRDDTEQVNKFKEIAATYGLYLVEREGQYMPLADANYLARVFGKHISAGVKAYLAFAKKNEQILEDGSLTIPHDELRERILLGDAIIRQFPNNDLAKIIKPEIENLLYLYLIGISTDMVYDKFSPEPALRAEVKASYNRFLKESKNSNYHSLIKFCYDLWVENNFMYTEKIIDTIIEKINTLD